LYVAAEVVRLILMVSDLQMAGIKANNSFDAFHIAAKQGHLGKLFLAFFSHQHNGLFTIYFYLV
jgi:hypothetical protein